MKSVKQGIDAKLNCPDCGKPLVIKFGKAGSFLACSSYPKCRFTSNYTHADDGSVQIVERTHEEQVAVGQCPKCGKALVVKKSHAGSRFIACTGYPDCDYVQSFSTGVICPKCKVGELVERSSKKGKVFYSCNTYPACDFATVVQLTYWKKEVAVVPNSCAPIKNVVMSKRLKKRAIQLTSYF